MASLQVVVMGVSATGKSTVGRRVADELGWDFIEGDDLHPPSNVVKMESGEPLDDADRAPWLEEINRVARAQAAADRNSVVTCSALKRTYRAQLCESVEAMFFVHLHASHEVLQPRMQQRARHFMPTGLLRSQFDTLEPLGEDEDGVVVDVTPGLDEVVGAAVAAVRARAGV